MPDAIVTIKADDRIEERRFVMRSEEVDKMLNHMHLIYKEVRCQHF
jgi:hypothetical protein